MTALVLKAKDLTDALDKIVLVAPVKEMSLYGIQFNKKRVRVIGHDSERTISINLTGIRCDGEGDYYFLDPTTLKQALKGRDEVELSFTDKLEFKAGKFKGDLKLFEPNPSIAADIKYALSVDDVSNSVEIDHEFFTSLGDGVKISRLKDPYNDAYIPSATIIYDGKRLTVMGTDDYHLHVYRRTLKSKKTPSIKITIPTSVFSVLDKVIKDDTKFFITDDRFCIKGAGVVVNLPPIETDVSLEQVENFISSLKKPITSFPIGSKFAEAYQSISAFFRKGVSTLAISITDSKLFLKYQNDAGSVSDTIKIKSKVAALEANIDPAVFDDTYKNIKANKEIMFSIFANRDGRPTCYSFETEYGKGTLSAYGYFKE